MSLVRTFLNVAGGALVANGSITGGTMETIAGIAIPLASAIWGMFVHAPTKVVARAEELKKSGLA